MAHIERNTPRVKYWTSEGIGMKLNFSNQSDVSYFCAKLHCEFGGLVVDQEFLFIHSRLPPPSSGFKPLFG